jgi:hypothetical protein
MTEEFVELKYGCPLCEARGRREFGQQPIQLVKELDGWHDFECPQCGSVSRYNFRKVQAGLHIVWATRKNTGLQYTTDCQFCGEKLTVYMRAGSTTDHSLCRACGKKRDGNMISSLMTFPPAKLQDRKPGGQELPGQKPGWKR